MRYDYLFCFRSRRRLSRSCRSACGNVRHTWAAIGVPRGCAIYGSAYLAEAASPCGYRPLRIDSTVVVRGPQQPRSQGLADAVHSAIFNACIPVSSRCAWNMCSIPSDTLFPHGTSGGDCIWPMGVLRVIRCDNQVPGVAMGDDRHLVRAEERYDLAWGKGVSWPSRLAWS